MNVNWIINKKWSVNFWLLPHLLFCWIGFCLDIVFTVKLKIHNTSNDFILYFVVLKNTVLICLNWIILFFLLFIVLVRLLSEAQTLLMIFHKSPSSLILLFQLLLLHRELERESNLELLGGGGLLSLLDVSLAFSLGGLWDKDGVDVW